MNSIDILLTYVVAFFIFIISVAFVFSSFRIIFMQDELIKQYRTILVNSSKTIELQNEYINKYKLILNESERNINEQ